MMSRAVGLQRDGTQFPARFAAPDAASPVPGVVLLHEILGFTPRVEALPARYAGAGFAALTFDLFARHQAPLPDGDSLEEVRRFASAQPDARTAADIGAALEALAAQPEVDATRLAVVGYSFGGTQALHANAAGFGLRAVVAYYPKPVYPALLPARPRHVVDAVPDFTAPVQVHFGERDRVIPLDEVEQLRAALARRGLPHEVHVYAGARHGFDDPADGRAADQAAAAQAWVRTLGFLRRYLA